MYVLTGSPGSGKTQLAAEYALQRIAEKWFVAWVSAGDISRMIAILAAGAAAFEPVPDGERERNVAMRLRDQLACDGSTWLLVFDGAASAADLSPFMPVSGESRIIITSSHKALADLDCVPVDVDGFTMEESVDFLCARTGNTDRAKAGEVAAELGFLPLALAQAAAVIKHRGLSYVDYLAQLRGIPRRFLPRADGDPYPRSAPEAIILALESVPGARSAPAGS